MTHNHARLPLLLIFCLLAFGIASESFADEQDLINVYAGRSETWDNNLFRLPENVDPFPLTGGHERAERISDTYAGIQADKPLGLQKFHLDATYSSYKYQHYKNLDATTRDYNAAWKWALTPQLTGTLSGEKNQSVTDFLTYQLYTKPNVVTTDHRYFFADWAPLGNWHLVGTLSNGSSRNSEQQYSQVASSQYRTEEGGVKYVYPSGTSMAVLYRKTFGDYLNRVPDAFTQIDSGYRQYDKEIVIEWPITGKSRIDARMGYEKRKHDNFVSRDYAGRTGRLAYTTEITGKIFVTASGDRSYHSYQDTYSSYNISDVESIQAKWMTSTKLGFVVRLDSTRTNYYGEIVASAPRNDRVNTSNLEFDWTPVKEISLIGKTARQRRKSTLTGFDFTDTSSTLTLQVKF